MKKYVRNISSKIGKPPGSLIHVGERKRDEVGITLIRYDGRSVDKKEITLEELLALETGLQHNWWIVVDGLHDMEIIRSIGNKFEIGRIVLENAVNTVNRPNIEIYSKYSFIVTKKIFLNKNRGIEYEQISMVVGNNFIITFTENGLDDFENLYGRLQEKEFRSQGVGFLSYLIMDMIVDNYFLVVEDISDRMEDAEKDIMDNPGNTALENIHRLKKELLLLHKAVWPQREVISTLLREHNSFSKGEMLENFRDIQEHLFQVVDMIEVFRDMLSNMLDIYLSSTSRRMNEIMKILTIISTVFIPLTFIAGVYGMNFSNMPELTFKYGYLAVLLLMALIALGMVLFFRKKKWF